MKIGLKLLILLAAGFIFTIISGYIIISGMKDTDDSLVITVFIIAALLIFMGSGLVIHSFIKRSLMKYITFTKSVGDGDLTAHIDMNSKDEFGFAADSLNKMVEKLRNSLYSIVQSADEAAGLSKKLDSSVENITSKMKSIDSATEEIASGLENTSSSSQEISASSQEIDAAVTQLAQSAEASSNSALSIRDKAEEIKDKVDKSIESAVDLYGRKKQKILDVIEEGKVVGEIEQMAEIISTIAGQTNLLALNAAIEAALAGENGRGFGVVADEVRKLSQQSAVTVKKIQSVVKRVEQAFSDFTAESDDILQFIGEDIHKDFIFFREAAEQHKEDSIFLYNSSQQLTASLQEIAASADQTSKAIEEVSSSGEEVSASSEEISASMADITSAMESVTEVAVKQLAINQRLDALTHEFKI